MVCARCISSVGKILKKLSIDYSDIALGEVSLTNTIDEKRIEILKENLLLEGFELLDEQKAKLIGQIKSQIVHEIHHSQEPIKLKMSVILENRLNRSYGYLSRLFSSKEGITIEKFVISQRAERIKELLLYNEQTLSQIANEMGYSSVSHLSSQFKRETGMTPTQFKEISWSSRRPLDSM
ncbi:MAG: AraC family transcriptional regulator [Bacteroidia bacterium]|nr:AraC family transcriptional regulator [Bacteroidia bacterium]